MKDLDLQIMEDFNAQCSEVAKRVDVIIAFLRECLCIEWNIKEEEELIIRSAQSCI